MQSHTSDARLIKIIDAMSRREARNPRLSITKYQDAKLEVRVSAPLQCQDVEIEARVSDIKLETRIQHQINEGTQSLRLTFQYHRDAQMRSSRPVS